MSDYNLIIGLEAFDNVIKDEDDRVEIIDGLIQFIFLTWFRKNIFKEGIEE